MSHGDGLDRLHRALEEHGCAVRGTAAQCPAPDHDDRNASLSIGQGRDSAVLNCHAGCATDVVLEALSMSAADLFDEPRERNGSRSYEVVATYTYTDEAGNPLFSAERRRLSNGRKDFRQYHIKDGEKIWKLPGRRVLYRLPGVIEAVKNGETIYVVEGEKDVHAIEAKGAVATCNPMGAGKWQEEYGDALKGAKVIVVADNDEAGRLHAQAVAADLRAKAESVRVVVGAVGRDKADVSDHLDAGYTLAELVPIGRRGKPEELGNAPGGSWAPADLQAILDGGCTDPKPVMLARDDGALLLYAGKTHTISGESESLKTWLALLAAVEVINDGGLVLYIDYEDTAAGITGRLVALGCSAAAIVSRFRYVRPEEPYGAASAATLAAHLNDEAAALAVIDGITEAMTAHGLDPLSNTDVAVFNARLPKPLADAGAAVAMIDHVTKSREGRGRYAIGGQHKLSAVSGAAYIVELLRPFGHGQHGMAKIIVAKDRPGRVRENCHDGVAGILHLRSEQDGSVFASVKPAREFGGEESAEFRPTVLMERISLLCETKPGLSKNALVVGVKGKTDHKKLALELLVRDGYITAERNGNSFRHKSAHPFRCAQNGQGELNLTPDPEPDPI